MRGLIIATATGIGALLGSAGYMVAILVTTTLAACSRTGVISDRPGDAEIYSAVTLAWSQEFPDDEPPYADTMVHEVDGESLLLSFDARQVHVTCPPSPFDPYVVYIDRDLDPGVRCELLVNALTNVFMWEGSERSACGKPARRAPRLFGPEGVAARAAGVCK